MTVEKFLAVANGISIYHLVPSKNHPLTLLEKRQVIVRALTVANQGINDNVMIVLRCECLSVLSTPSINNVQLVKWYILST